MPAPTIDALPIPPSRGDSPTTFSEDADAFLGALPDFGDQLNAVAAYLATLESGTLSLLLAAIDAAGSGTDKLPYYTGANAVSLTDLTSLARTILACSTAAAVRSAIGAGTGTGDVVASNNLSDLANASTALTNLGLTANGKSLVTAANYAAMRTALGLVIGTDVQAFSSVLATYAGITPSSNVQSLLGAANYAAMKTLLGLTIGSDIPARSPSIQTPATNAASITPTFADDQVNLTGHSVAIVFNNPTGTAVDGWGIALRIKDNGTARAITFGSQYRAIGVTLPTTTVISKTLYIGMVFNNADTKWDVVAVAQEV